MKNVYGLLFVALTVAAPAADAEPGLLVIDVVSVELNNRGEVAQRARWSARSYNLLNMETHKLVSNFFPFRGVWAVELDEGIYCLEAVKLFDNFQVDYCGEPYFKVLRGRVNNAGRWQFGISSDLKHHRLVSSLEDLEQTLAQAQRINESLFTKYAPKPVSPAASSAP